MSSSKYDRLFFEKEKTKKQQKVFDELIKALTFALPFEPRFKKRVTRESRKIFERMETTARKSSIYGKVCQRKKYTIETVRFRERLR